MSFLQSGVETRRSFTLQNGATVLHSSAGPSDRRTFIVQTSSPHLSVPESEAYDQKYVVPEDLFEDQPVLLDERSNLRTSEQDSSSWILPSVGFVDMSSREEARVCLQIPQGELNDLLIKLQLDTRRSTRFFSSWIPVSSHSQIQPSACLC